MAPMSVAVSETDVRGVGRSAASDAAAAAIPASGAAVGRGGRAWRPAATPDRGTPPPPRATARSRPRRLRRTTSEGRGASAP